MMGSAMTWDDNLEKQSVLGVSISVSSYDQVVTRSLAWAARRESRTLCFAPVHMIMEAVDDPVFRDRLNAADMVNPDGMPVVWALRLLGKRKAQRVYGPDATLAVLTAAEKAGVPVGFYGGSQPVLDALIYRVRALHPSLDIAFHESPPFRALTAAEDNAVINRIASSGARLLFVGLGCPKQENWIFDHRDRVPAVMFAVGAAFDFIAGSKRQAPRWMMAHGLEWVFRFATEPRRLAMRYIKHNPRFVFFLLRQLLTGRV
jgi:N-acetylglucosaminyldiphosphoundecaprenol N-acetyl-beta-D-mannosaminyltransferase